MFERSGARKIILAAEVSQYSEGAESGVALVGSLVECCRIADSAMTHAPKPLPLSPHPEP